MHPRYALLILPILLGGCLGQGMQNWSAEQIKATNGMATCSTVSSVYGKASTATVNMDDVRKGATSQGKTAVTCGDATMVIDTNIGVGGSGLPAGAVTVTPMTLTPATIVPTK